MSDPISQGLGALLLLCGFGLLACRRPEPRWPDPMIALYRIEAVILAAAAFWQGHLQGDAALVLGGCITLAGKAVLLPRLLRRIARRLEPMPAAPALLAGLPVLFGLGLLGLAILLLPPGSRAGLLSPLTVLLLGLLLIATRRDLKGQTIGFLSMENGLMLAAVTVPGLPLVAVLAVASLLLATALPVALVLFGLPNDRTAFETIGGPGA